MCVPDARIIYIARLLHLLPVSLALLLMLMRKMRKKFVTLIFTLRNIGRNIQQNTIIVDCSTYICTVAYR